LQVTWQSVVFLFCVGGFVSGCAMSDETSLVGALNGETEWDAPVVQQDQPAQTTPAADVKVAGNGTQSLSEEEERAATMEHLRALALANQDRRARSLSTSVAELKRIQATHGDTALSEISGANAAQN
jgi:flagellar basal body rod protein FlgF